jgi:hypothetical protein
MAGRVMAGLPAEKKPIWKIPQLGIDKREDRLYTSKS